MPFIVLSDSTLQYLLWMDGSGKSYGVETLDRDPLRQAIICPGASLVMPREGAMRTPPVLEVLAWHFIRVLGHVQPFPTDHQPLTDLLKSHYYSDTCVRLIPLRESLNPNKQGAYDWLADVRDQYGLSGDELAGQTIMSLQGNDPNLVEHLYPPKDCHFRPSIAEQAIGLLLGRARTEMMRTHPNSVHVLVVCSWNVKGDFVHQEMHATAELCRAKTLRELGSIAARHTHKPWVLRQFFEPEASDRPMPLTAFQTYIHDDKPEPRAVFKERLPEFQRTFCNDEDLLTTLTLHAGEHGAHLCTNLKQPAHRADIFRYIYHYTHGGLYIDIKFGFKVQFAHLMDILATDWGLAQKQQCLERGLGPTQVGKLPPEFLLMAIGIKKDHIFQGIIYGQPRHPLFMRAIAHAFSKEIFAKIANLEYMIFCKALWRFLKDDLKAEPRVGWNISPTYGPVYLLQEQHSHKLKSKQDMGNDGHYFVTATNITVAYTRCWSWQKGFKGDPAANERRATTMLKSPFRRLLRQPWTLSVILVRMDRGLCPGETSSVMTYRLASPATASRTSWKQFARSGTTLTSLLRMLCAASPVASSCTRPNLAGFPVGIALVTVNSLSSPTTSVSSTTSHAAGLIIRPSPLRLRAAPVLLPLTLQPPQHQLRMHLHPRLPHPV